MATWTAPPNAKARVVRAEVRGDRAEVIVDTEPNYLDYVYCQRTSAGWHVTVGGNGPCVGWHDPDAIHWSWRTAVLSVPLSGGSPSLRTHGLIDQRTPPDSVA